MHHSLRLPSLAAALLVAGACVAPAPRGREVLNDVCPRSGKPVASDSLTTYRGFTVGFCNPHCRDDFAAHPEACADDRASFDRLIDEGAPRRE